MSKHKDLEKGVSTEESIKMDKRKLRDLELDGKERAGLVLRLISKLKNLSKKS